MPDCRLSLGEHSKSRQYKSLSIKPQSLQLKSRAQALMSSSSSAELATARETTFLSSPHRRERPETSHRLSESALTPTAAPLIHIIARWSAPTIRKQRPVPPNSLHFCIAIWHQTSSSQRDLTVCRAAEPARLLYEVQNPTSPTQHSRQARIFEE